MLRTYLVDDKGQEHTMKFSPEDWWAGDLYSFTTGNPSSYNVQCLEDTEVLHITQPDMDLLFEAMNHEGTLRQKAAQENNQTNPIINFKDLLDTDCKKEAFELA